MPNRNSRFPRSMFMLLALLGASITARAAEDVVVVLEVFAVQKRDGGEETFSAAERAMPGDVLEYRATYRNRGNATARKLEATLPVPAGNIAYIADSARPQRVLASLDGQRFEPAPLKRTVKLADGRQQVQTVPPAEYRFLRWQLGDLAAGASTTVVSRMRVDPLPPSRNAQGGQP
ncbi:hypothetical protein [Uliginosibacterium sp. H1]|uniref:hypothetical protein n=1 Tax=Uliginosibacterium sp. H1 TaxID=3114757 RepID=UPI002E187838|nr:hypothetical protein [Uliginosibacterium sp. H1]